MGKTIKQIAAELDISKQAVWQRVKRSEELSALLETHAETVNGTIYVDADLEQCIKAMYPDRLTPSAVDNNTVNMSAPVDETAVNVDVNALVETLQNTVNTLKQQLMEKDTQIAGLTSALSEAQQVQIQLSSALETAQQTQKQLTDALAAAQALHAGTIQMQQQVQQQQPETPVVDTSSDLDPEGTGDAIVQLYSEKKKEKKKHRGFLARLFGKE